MKVEDTFAFGAGTSTIDCKACKRIKDKVEAGNFDPFIEYHDHQCHVVFDQRRNWIVTDRNELSKVN